MKRKKENKPHSFFKKTYMISDNYAIYFYASNSTKTHIIKQLEEEGFKTCRLSEFNHAQTQILTQEMKLRYKLHTKFFNLQPNTSKNETN